jgi:hypothetical protein
MFATDRRLWRGGGGNGGWPCHYVTYTLIKLSNNWDDVNAAHLLIKKSNLTQNVALPVITALSSYTSKTFVCKMARQVLSVHVQRKVIFDFPFRIYR